MTVLGETADIQAITRVVHSCARALDRLDRELLLDCFHPGATDDHAPFYTGTATGFVDWVLPTLAGMLATRHAVSNVLVWLAGDEAGVESYWSATLRIGANGGFEVLRREGRYLDRFARLAGRWAIMHRQSVTEWNRTEAECRDLAPAAIPRAAIASAAIAPARDRSDPSYNILEPRIR